MSEPEPGPRPGPSAEPEPGPSAGFATRAVHGARAEPATQQPSSTPIYQSSTWQFESVGEFAQVIGGERHGYVYGRGYGNPTVEAFESTLADLEGTEAAFAFDSGMAAIHAVLTTLASTGDTVVASTGLYGGTYSLFSHLLPRYGIKVRFVDTRDHQAIEGALGDAVTLYLETVANPTLAVADLGAIAAMCRDAGVASVIDNTFASPYLCNPAAFGFDYVLHSASKYIGGHSDLVGGVVCTTAARRAALRSVSLDQGGAMQPFEAWLCLRGLATLALRMERHCANAAALSEWLSRQPTVSALYYPGQPNHPDHAVAARQLRGFGGMVAFEHRGGVAGGARLCDSLRLAWVAASLGGPHTLVAHPASTTHRQMDAQARAAAGLSDGLIRVSVGLEDPADIVGDFEHALAKSQP